MKDYKRYAVSMDFGNTILRRLGALNLEVNQNEANFVQLLLPDMTLNCILSASDDKGAQFLDVVLRAQHDTTYTVVEFLFSAPELVKQDLAKFLLALEISIGGGGEISKLIHTNIGMKVYSKRAYIFLQATLQYLDIPHRTYFS